MELNEFLGTVLVPSVISLSIALIGLISTIWMHKERLKNDIELAEKKANADIDLAKQKFNLERQMADWKRKSDLAEQVLPDFDKAAELFRSARRVSSFPGEGSSRHKQDDEQDGPSKDIIYAPPGTSQ